MADETKGTEYVVLHRVPSRELVVGPGDAEVVEAWQEVGRYTAANDLAAIKLAAADHGETVAWVAVPARSWRPRRREVQKIERERWS